LDKKAFSWETKHPILTRRGLGDHPGLSRTYNKRRDLFDCDGTQGWLTYEGWEREGEKGRGREQQC